MTPPPPRPSATPFDWTSAAKEAFLAEIRQKRDMDEDDRELAHRLSAVATAMLEDAIEMAVAGQSRRVPPSQLAVHARRLQASARDIAVIAEAAMIVANLSVERRRNRRKRSP